MGIFSWFGTKERMKRPCDEIYVVREGETLQTISENSLSVTNINRMSNGQGILFWNTWKPHLFLVYMLMLLLGVVILRAPWKHCQSCSLLHLRDEHFSLNILGGMSHS
ncbi:hypothetical protein Droror1_Dr00013216 [Drosera rotundifolia]